MTSSVADPLHTAFVGDGFAVLHALALYGPAARDVVAESCWLCPEHVDLTLDGLCAAGLVEPGNDGPTLRWQLTAAGQDTHVAAVAADAAAHLPLVEDAHRRLLVLQDTAFAAICHAWEVLPGGTANPHTDPAHDGAVLDRLTVLEREVAALTDALGRAIPRFGRYAPRFTAARNRAGCGEHAWLAGPQPGSYRTVWSELREDLLVTLGRGGRPARTRR